MIKRKFMVLIGENYVRDIQYIPQPKDYESDNWCDINGAVLVEIVETTTKSDAISIISNKLKINEKFLTCYEIKIDITDSIFLESDFFNNVKKFIINWDNALSDNQLTDSERKLYFSQWEIIQSALRFMTGTEWNFSRDDGHFGIVDDYENYLICFHK